MLLSPDIKEVQVTEESQNKIQDTHGRRSDTWSSIFWQFLRYCLVGGANTVIDLLTFNVLLWCFPMNNLLVLVGCNSIAYTSGAASSFFLNKYWTFGKRQVERGLT